MVPFLSRLRNIGFDYCSGTVGFELLQFFFHAGGSCQTEQHGDRQH
jgi:hypothetical protein